MPFRTGIVVPCYNEARRLRVGEFEKFLDPDGTDATLIFVDDGSRDETLAVLKRILAGREDRVRVLALPANCGKAEAVRHGMQYAFEQDFEYAGYWDADLATPLGAIAQLASVLTEKPEVEMVFGSRVKLLGRHVERKASRHYVGRVFATAASLVLKMPVYDTQCGAKMFRATETTRRLFDQPFLSRWIFDVEMIARYIELRQSAADAAQGIYEYPLHTWTDVGGSKLRAKDFARAAFDLWRISRKYDLRSV